MYITDTNGRLYEGHNTEGSSIHSTSCGNVGRSTGTGREMVHKLQVYRYYFVFFMPFNHARLIASTRVFIS